MGTTKLKVFNAALRELGHRKLSDTGENVVAGRELSDVWEDVVEQCLAEGSWNFAVETVKVLADTGITPQFGYKNVCVSHVKVGKRITYAE